jgi:TolB-like protein/Tfp pilus assembly protein PilF
MTDGFTRPGAILQDRYRLETELGRGGTSTVWRAEDLRHQRLVALKILRPDLATALAAERFVREIAFTGRLSHPNILPLFDSGAEGKLLFYVMPFVPGQTLRQRLQREKQLSVEEAVRITREIAEAIDYAHRHGVIHRDIKPENILWAENHAVVADFGVARAIASAITDEKLTETGLAVGTVHYMSPEQAAGDRVIDGRADIYALGCVLYEMLAGVPPFHGATADSVLRQHLAEMPRRLSAFRSALPLAIDQVVAKALSKAPADRWQTGAELVDALTTPAPEVHSRGPHRLRVWALAVSAVVLLALGVMLPTPRRWLLHPLHVSQTPVPLAVLCFDNVSHDTADTYLADGLSEEVIDRLGEVERINVKSWAVVERYCDRAAGSPVSLGQTLGVRYLVDGSVRRTAHHVHTAVELLETQSGKHLWGATFDRPDTDLVPIEADIATAVATGVVGRLSRTERRSLDSPVTRDPIAHDFYLRGNHFLAQRTARAVDRAIAEYDSALSHDPQYVEALARQAYGYALFLYYGWGYHDVSADSLLALGQARADRALRTDSTDAEAWLARGRMLAAVHPRTYEGAIAAYRRATQLDPRDPEPFNLMGAALRELGHDAEAVSAFDTALALDPDRATTLTLLGIQAALTGRYDSALRWADSALTTDPGFYDAYVSRGFYRLLLGDTAGASADAQVASQFAAGSHLSDETLQVLIEARTSRTTAARQRVARLLAAADTIAPAPLAGTLLARALLAIGDRERAVDLLERIRPQGAALWFWLRFHWFDGIRSDPRFARIVRSAAPSASEPK